MTTTTPTTEPSPAASPFRAKLIRREPVAERTVAFHFEKPAHFTFVPGQFLDVTLIAPPETDAEGNVRSFSIASAPHESTIMVATRVRDTAFKRVLQSMPLGTAVSMAGPSGDLTLDGDPARAAVILAGGIGITPFRSIVVDAARRSLPRRIWLFTSNRRPEDAPFLDELANLRSTNITVVATMTDAARSARSWSGETGFIDDKMLAHHAADAVSPIYYVAGPPQMVRGLHAMLRGSGVDESDIRTEEFDGY